jgi:hypothetical protein
VSAKVNNESQSGVKISVDSATPFSTDYRCKKNKGTYNYTVADYISENFSKLQRERGGTTLRITSIDIGIWRESRILFLNAKL